MSVNQEVRDASDRFYAGLSGLINGDAEAILGSITQGNQVSMLHPLGGQVVGAEQVRRNLQDVAMAVSNGKASAEDLVVVPLSEDLAYTVGIERAQGTIGATTVQFGARATNIYRRENGDWKLIHHHVDLVPEAAAALRKLMAGSAA
jgi:ketosteroid isomerase-like protein